ncbi:MAG: formylglycine-generating enzyme family protein, partial [Bacteroidota bacterium]|nr:formylglycine-generating enzyme family protein [Bacteroidota bacterium]
METKAYSEIGDSLKVESTCCKNNRNSFLLLENDSIEISSPLVVISNDSLKMVEEMILIEGGEFMMGSSSKEFALRREFPRHKVKVKSFLMDVHEVTNKQFAKFVEETGYITVAEKYIDWNELKNQLPP